MCICEGVNFFMVTLQRIIVIYADLLFSLVFILISILNYFLTIGFPNYSGNPFVARMPLGKKENAVLGR
jgi:hypothetical protein